MHGVPMNVPVTPPKIPPYRHTPLFPLGKDETPYKKISADGVRTETVLGREMLVVSRDAMRALSEAAFIDINHYLQAGPPEAAAQHPRRQGSLRQRQVRRLRLPEERQHCRRRRAADVPGHRHGDHHGQEGLARHHRGRRRGGARRRRARRLPEAQPALLAARAAVDVRGEEHAEQHARAVRNLCGGRGRLQVHVHGQGRRLGQQELPVPGDAVDPDARPHAGVPEGEGADPRHRGVSAVSPRHRHRRHLGRTHHEDGEACVGALSRCAADAGLGRRPRLPRSGDGAGNPEDDAVARRRRAVRRQILLPRRACDPPAAARRVVADRPRRLLLGRPADPRQDHEGRRLSRGTRASSGKVPARGDGKFARRRRGEDRPQQADEGHSCDARRRIRSRRASR